MNRSQVQIFGAGGHAKVVIATAQAAGYEVVAVWDDDPGRWHQTCLGVPIRGAVEAAPPIQTVIAIGDNRARAAIASRVDRPWITLVHPTCYVHASCSIGPGTVVFAGSVIQPDTRVGAHTIVNTAASIDHDCAISDFVHIGPGVHLCGGVTVDEGALVGVGAVGRPGVHIGRWAVIGAGAAVVTEVPADARFAGVPARHLRSS